MQPRPPRPYCQNQADTYRPTPSPTIAISYRRDGPYMRPGLLLSTVYWSKIRYFGLSSCLDCGSDGGPASTSSHMGQYISLPRGVHELTYRSDTEVERCAMKLPQPGKGLLSRGKSSENERVGLPMFGFNLFIWLNQYYFALWSDALPSYSAQSSFESG
jgi:hypothetical protein